MVDKPLDQKPGKGYLHRGDKKRLTSQAVL